MFLTAQKLLACFVLASACSLASAFQAGEYVFANLSTDYLQVGTQDVASIDHLRDFLVVIETKSDWVWVERRSTLDSQSPGPTGWIRSRNLLSLEQFIQHIDQLFNAEFKATDAYHVLLGSFYASSEQPAHLKIAIGHYCRAIERDPRSAGTYVLRAVCFAKLNDMVSYLADVRQAAKLAPENTQITALVEIGEEALRQLDPAPPALVSEEQPVAAPPLDDTGELLQSASTSHP